MRIIPFRKKGRVYELQDEITLNYDEHGIQIIASGVRVFITEKNGKLKSELIIKIPDVKTKLKVNPDDREFILSKRRKAREEL